MSDTIYFLLNERENAIKIGFSSQPEKRIAALSGGDRGRLTSLGFVSGTRAHEKELHRLLQQFRLNGWQSVRAAKGFKPRRTGEGSQPVYLEMFVRLRKRRRCSLLQFTERKFKFVRLFAQGVDWRASV